MVVAEELRSKELGPFPGEIGVYDETDPLQILGVWGEPGCSTVLGQLLPLETSLFFDNFDVVEARREFGGMEELFTQQGIAVVRLKDVFADSLRDSVSERYPASLDDLALQIRQRGLDFYKEHQIGNVDVLDLVERLLAEDAEKYGEETAIKLNYIVSLRNPLPCANIFYARDQSNVIGGKIVMSRMKWPIRNPEVEIYAQAYSHLGYDTAVVSPGAGNLEGGDVIILDNTCYIGVGTRTNREGVFKVYNAIGKELQEAGIRMVAVVDSEQVEMDLRKPGADMDAMHLDTFWMPIDENTVLACGEEVKKRRVELVTEAGFEDFGTLSEYMDRNNLKVIDTTKEEQLNYATNFLHIGHGNIIAPRLLNNTGVIKKLEAAGLNVFSADVKALVNGFGAVHCMTASLLRG